MMSVIPSRCTQHYVACNMSFISGSIRTINHQVIISRSSISGYHDIMMMNMRRSLFRHIIRPVKSEIHGSPRNPGIVRMMIEIIMNLYLIRF